MTATMVRTHVPQGDPPTAVLPATQLSVPGWKPRGFWYEVDGDWRRWCEAAGTGWCDDRPVLGVQPGDERILTLRSAYAIDKFTTEYGGPPDYDLGTGRARDRHGWSIDWARVAESYDGIEIAPYCWPRRMTYLWYYGWDCASGCIWTPRGVQLTQEADHE
jgi:hypothetical protein